MKNTVRIAMGAGMAGVMALSAMPQPALADPVSDEAAFVHKLNGLRATRGLRPLVVNGALTNMARGWSSQMASRGSISHNSDMAAHAPAGWARLGENVGMGGSVDSLHNAFVASPPHYANMVHVQYDSVGVGVVQSGATKFVTFNFMATQMGHVATAAPAAPRPGPVARSVCRRSRRGRVVCRRAKVRASTARRGRVAKARRGKVSGARARRR